MFIFCQNFLHFIIKLLGVFRRNPETGLLTQLNVLPISGRYPTDVNLFPDEKHIFVTNYDSNTITIFSLYYDKGNIVMAGAPIPVGQPKCSLVVEVPAE